MIKPFGENEEVKIDIAHAELLTGLVMCDKPRRILEIGVGGGRSLDAILKGLDYNQAEYSYTLVDNWGDWAGVMPPEVQERYGDRIDIITSNEKDFVFSCTGQFDFIMSDGDHNSTDQWFDYVYDNLLADSGILVYHDVNFVNNWPGIFRNLQNIYHRVNERGISHKLFNLSTLPTEQCERGLLVIYKND